MAQPPSFAGSPASPAFVPQPSPAVAMGSSVRVAQPPSAVCPVVLASSRSAGLASFRRTVSASDEAVGPVSGEPPSADAVASAASSLVGTHVPPPPPAVFPVGLTSLGAAELASFRRNALASDEAVGRSLWSVVSGP